MENARGDADCRHSLSYYLSSVRTHCSDTGLVRAVAGIGAYRGMQKYAAILTTAEPILEDELISMGCGIDQTDSALLRRPTSVSDVAGIRLRFDPPGDMQGKYLACALIGIPDLASQETWIRGCTLLGSYLTRVAGLPAITVLAKRNDSRWPTGLYEVAKRRGFKSLLRAEGDELLRLFILGK